jgi:hypothetical protein
MSYQLDKETIELNTVPSEIRPGSKPKYNMNPEEVEDEIGQQKDWLHDKQIADLQA